ncbi:helix-turn-helix domain-containing protein [Paenibacillus sp. 481]|uniref:helix-turn-helix domain-containing protein n=1 Tax=Paenibacillus sp. 481 TaxID=2835869 RepID=UPI001E4414AD|nr:helix-turn-helix transcriptional regulator [Paenibacillus sp. 481]UHA75073.1 helix-turn-helix transcriptional regulator [Paenibacillus sp. 481]
MKTVSLHYTTIGDLIRQRRQEIKLSLRRLSQLSGVDKAGLSRIENGGTKRPEFRTLQALAAILHIPHEELIHHYVQVEDRPDVLHELMLEAIQASDPTSMIKLATGLLQSPREDSYDLVAQLYQTATSVTDVQLQLMLYQIITDYSRSHGIQQYFTRGLLQRYYIEKNDPCKYESAYKLGQEVVYYAEFLCPQDRVELHYILGVQAYNMMLYEDAIQLCTYVLEQHRISPSMNMYARLTICGAYYELGLYAEGQHLLSMSNRPHTTAASEVTNITAALINGKLGHIEDAIEQLYTCLDDCLQQGSHASLLYIITGLMELLLANNDTSTALQLLAYEDIILNLPMNTPLQQSKRAYYFRLKGDLFCRIEQYDAAFDHFFISALEYAKIHLFSKAFQTLGLITKVLLKVELVYSKAIVRKIDLMYDMLCCHMNGRS